MLNPPVDYILRFFGNDCLADVVAELNDPRFGNRQHGTRRTNELGCSGPMCRLIEKRRGRLRTQRKAAREGKTIRSRGREYDRDDLLDEIIKWHRVDLAMRRARSVA